LQEPLEIAQNSGRQFIKYRKESSEMLARDDALKYTLACLRKGSYQ